jgi:DNA-binding NarL/FixJ family response regulator
MAWGLIANSGRPSLRFLISWTPEGIMTSHTSILLVDDNPTFLHILTRFLHEYNQGEVVVVGTAGGGEQALVQARELRPDIVLIDLAMPDLPGLEAIPRLRQALPEMGIIALTMLGPNGYREAALAAGANEFVSKTTLSIDLPPALRRVARAQRHEQGPDQTRSREA